MLLARPVIALALAFSASSSIAQDGCGQPSAKSIARPFVECLFFSGTKHFRDKEYSQAFAQWQTIVDLPELSAELEPYRLDAFNNLGFLLYMGWGTTPHHQRALQLWQRAYRSGHAEAAYHLCHFYGERAEPEFEPASALGYCREALRRYSLSGSEPQSEAVISQVKIYISSLESR